MLFFEFLLLRLFFNNISTIQLKLGLEKSVCAAGRPGGELLPNEDPIEGLKRLLSEVRRNDGHCQPHTPRFRHRRQLLFFTS